MAAYNFLTKLARPAVVVGLSVCFLALSFMLTSATEQEAWFGKYYNSLLLLNLIGVVVLIVLIGINIWSLWKQFRRKVLGSRLTLKFFGAFALLTIVPLGAVYYFAVQFLHYGIDSWFDVRIEQALDDALLLGQRSMAATKQGVLARVRGQATQLAEANSELQIVAMLGEMREQSNYSEMSLYSANGHIIAASQIEARSLVPDSPDKHVMTRLRNNFEFSSLEPVGADGLQLRIVLPVTIPYISRTAGYLQVLYPMPLRYAALGANIQAASAEYEKLVYLRVPLKLNFVLTLSLMALMSALIALWLALYLSKKMVEPLRQLAEGTKAVAAGDYHTVLRTTSKDELGVLVQSFNDMTTKIRDAQLAVAQSHQFAAEQHAYLETVLAHLSSGVLSFDASGYLRTHNSAAAHILHINPDDINGQTIAAIIALYPHTETLFSSVYKAMHHNVAMWHSEITISSNHARQTLMCRATQLPSAPKQAGGYVVVFDDISALVVAQRHLAWSEVARRLAHEIKNPLTPIQLSAERIRHKFLHQLSGADQHALDRATNTIVQQVKAMKLMVNAFSEYAQPRRMHPAVLDLNALITDVTELYVHSPSRVTINLELAANLPIITADKSHLRQILNNLIANANTALANTANPSLVISTKLITSNKLPQVLLRCTDNGPGFAPQLLDNIFEPYVSTKPKGSGLGLAIVKRLVEEHGGVIEARNSPKIGATVAIFLPLEGAQPHLSEADAQSALPTDNDQTMVVG